MAERRLLAGQNADLASLMKEVVEPPVADIGALPVNSFFRKSERTKLAAALNTLLASPTFASWREGAPLDIDDWVKPRGGKTPCVVVSVAHLDDEERALVLGILLEEILSWVRGLRGPTSSGRCWFSMKSTGFCRLIPPIPRPSARSSR